MSRAKAPGDSIVHRSSSVVIGRDRAAQVGPESNENSSTTTATGSVSLVGRGAAPWACQWPSRRQCPWWRWHCGGVAVVVAARHSASSAAAPAVGFVFCFRPHCHQALSSARERRAARSSHLLHPPRSCLRFAHFRVLVPLHFDASAPLHLMASILLVSSI